MKVRDINNLRTAVEFKSFFIDRLDDYGFSGTDVVDLVDECKAYIDELKDELARLDKERSVSNLVNVEERESYIKVTLRELKKILELLYSALDSSRLTS